MKPHDAVAGLCGPFAPRAASGSAFAAANIALVKYWGKRDEQWNLPLTDSLSISLRNLGAHTTVSPAAHDRLILNGKEQGPTGSAARRVTAFLDLFRRDAGPAILVESRSNLPVGAGLASSAAGFAALVLALDRLCGWDLPARELSILARLGSGSACRSLFPGFVRWHAGRRPDGMDSFAEPLAVQWPELRLGLVIVTAAPKAVSSRAGMRHTRATSLFYRAWPERVAQDLAEILAALAARDLEKLGSVAEGNAMAMHATMLDARPPLSYWQPDTVAVLRKIWDLRASGVPVYCTMDAGPNVKLLFPEAAEKAVRQQFASLQVIAPFDKP